MHRFVSAVLFFFFKFWLLWIFVAAHGHPYSCGVPGESLANVTGTKACGLTAVAGRLSSCSMLLPDQDETCIPCIEG